MRTSITDLGVEASAELIEKLLEDFVRDDGSA
jgi:hypothetical protein